MPLKNFNPTTPSRRSLVLVDRSSLHKGSPVKKLTKGLTKTGGRNNKGRITMWWKGGGHKKSYRLIENCAQFPSELSISRFSLI